jgi:hypothetical protein
MVDPEIWLPGIYIARVVATMSDNDDNTEISTEVHGSPRWSEVPLDSIDAGNLNSPSEKCEKLDKLVTSQELAGSGESQPELPPNSLRNIAVDRLQGVAIGLQGKESFLPVGNRFGNHTDTAVQNSGLKGSKGKHTREIEVKEPRTKEIGIRESRKGGSKIIGYVPIQIINLSLKEVMLPKPRLLTLVWEINWLNYRV